MVPSAMLLEVCDRSINYIVCPYSELAKEFALQGYIPSIF